MRNKLRVSTTNRMI